MGEYLSSLPRFIVVVPVVLLLVGGLLGFAFNLNSKGKWYNVTVGGFSACVFFCSVGLLLYYVQIPDITPTGQITDAVVIDKTGVGYDEPYHVTLKKGNQKFVLDLDNDKSGSALSTGSVVDVSYNANFDILSVKYSEK